MLVEGKMESYRQRQHINIVLPASFVPVQVEFWNLLMWTRNKTRGQQASKNEEMDVSKLLSSNIIDKKPKKKKNKKQKKIKFYF